MSEMFDMRGWDEFSAYAWLNSVGGKKSINWPLDEVVPLKVVREYIAKSNPGDRMPPRPKQDPEPIPVVEEKMTDLEYLLEPLQEFADRILDLIRIGLEKDSE